MLFVYICYESEKVNKNIYCIIDYKDCLKYVFFRVYF